MVVDEVRAYCPRCGFGHADVLQRTRYGLFVRCRTCRVRWLPARWEPWADLEAPTDAVPVA